MPNRAVGTSNIDYVLATTLDNYNANISDAVYNGITTFRILKKLGRVLPEDGGDQLTENILWAENTTVASMSPTGTISTVIQNELTQLAFTWRLYGGSVAIPNIYIRNNERDEYKIINLMEAKMKILELQFQQVLNRHLFAASPASTDIDPLTNIVNTNSLAGSSASFWQSTVTASGSFAGQGITDMRTNYLTVSQGEDTPHLLVADKTTYGYYENSQEAKQRYVDTNNLFDAGADALAFKKAAVIADANCQSGVIYLMNLNYLTVKYHPKANITLSSKIDVFDQDVTIIKAIWQGNVTTPNRRMHGKLTGVTA